MKFIRISQIAKGWSSYIWLVKDSRGREMILKEVREKSPRKDLAEREGKMLLLANSVGVGPHAFEVNYKKNYVLMEYVRGVKLFDFVFSEEFSHEVTREELWNLLKELYKQMLALDTISLSHNQLQIGKNILVQKTTDKKTGELKYVPTVIDFEKASIKPNGTKNRGQIESMLFYNPHGALAQKIREKLHATL